MANYPYPVIFLPGIMGSALRDEYPVAPETVWSPFKLLIKAYDRITPHPSDPRYELNEPARVVADQVFEIVYSEFVEELRHNLSPQTDEPVPVYPFAYDWRQPLENLENSLAGFVDEVIDRTKLLRHYHDSGYGTKDFPAQVNLAGHSTGGLIIASYLQKYGEDKVSRVATMGSPFRGSLESVAKTATGVAALGTSPGSSREREAARGLRPSLGLFVGRARRQLRFQIGRGGFQNAAKESTTCNGIGIAFQEAVVSDDERGGHTRLFALQPQK